MFSSAKSCPDHVKKIKAAILRTGRGKAPGHRAAYHARLQIQFAVNQLHALEDITRRQFRRVCTAPPTHHRLLQVLISTTKLVEDGLLRLLVEDGLLRLLASTTRLVEDGLLRLREDPRRPTDVYFDYSYRLLRRTSTSTTSTSGRIDSSATASTPRID